MTFLRLGQCTHELRAHQNFCAQCSHKKIAIAGGGRKRSRRDPVDMPVYNADLLNRKAPLPHSPFRISFCAAGFVMIILVLSAALPQADALHAGPLRRSISKGSSSPVASCWAAPTLRAFKRDSWGEGEKGADELFSQASPLLEELSISGDDFLPPEPRAETKSKNQPVVTDSWNGRSEDQKRQRMEILASQKAEELLRKKDASSAQKIAAEKNISIEEAQAQVAAVQRSQRYQALALGVAGPGTVSGVGVGVGDLGGVEGVAAEGAEPLTYFLLQAGANHAEVAGVLSAAGAFIRAVQGNPFWRTNLQYLLDDQGFTGQDLAQLLQAWPDFLAVECDATGYMETEVLDYLYGTVGLRRSEVRKVVRRAPQLLAPRADGTSAADTAAALALVGLRPRALRAALVAHPRLLAHTPRAVFECSAFLMSKDVGAQAAHLGALYKRAPWLPGRPVAELRAVARWLRQIGVEDVENVFRGYPEVALRDVEELDAAFLFLLEEVGLAPLQAALVVQAYPSALALDLGAARGVLAYLSGPELGLSAAERQRVLRAFPSLLAAPVRGGLAPVVAYLREELGVRAPGRFVSAAPAVLGFDVARDLRPKAAYLRQRAGLGAFDLLRFPACLTYPLEEVIAPRTEFLALCRRPVGQLGLNKALAPGDDDFAAKVALTRPETYQLFKKAFRRKQQQAQRRRQGVAEAEGLTDPGLVAQLPRWDDRGAVEGAGLGAVALFNIGGRAAAAEWNKGSWALVEEEGEEQPATPAPAAEATDPADAAVARKGRSVGNEEEEGSTRERLLKQLEEMAASSTSMAADEDREQQQQQSGEEKKKSN